MDILGIAMAAITIMLCVVSLVCIYIVFVRPVLRKSSKNAVFTDEDQPQETD